MSVLKERAKKCAMCSRTYAHRLPGSLGVLDTTNNAYEITEVHYVSAVIPSALSKFFTVSPRSVKPPHPNFGVIYF